MFLESIFYDNFFDFFYWAGPGKKCWFGSGTMETHSTVHMQREQWSRANETEEGEGEREEQATLCGGEVWLAEAAGELRYGFPLFLLFFLLFVSAMIFYCFGLFSPR